jgi:hypothetical protein
MPTAQLIARLSTVDPLAPGNVDYWFAYDTIAWGDVILATATPGTGTGFSGEGDRLLQVESVQVEGFTNPPLIFPPRNYRVHCAVRNVGTQTVPNYALTFMKI